MNKKIVYTNLQSQIAHDDADELARALTKARTENERLRRALEWAKKRLREEGYTLDAEEAQSLLDEITR